MPRKLIATLVLLSLSACADRTELHILPEARAIGALQQVFVVTNRGQDETQNFDQSRSHETAYLKTDVSVPPSHKAGELTYNNRNPDPAKDFVIADQTNLGGNAAFERALKRAIAARPAAERDVTIFVHGYNTSYSEALYRMAQMANDMNTRSVSVLFSWPSAAKIAGYDYDHDSVDFSRDALQQTIRSVTKIAPGRTLLVGHSMGTMLTMEALRQIEIEFPGYSSRNLSGVALISPDIDVDVFKTQLDRFEKLPQPFVVFVNSYDRVLVLSGIVNGRFSRLGHEVNVDEIADYPILMLDISEFADGSGGNHFTVGSSSELMDYLTSPQMRDAIEKEDYSGGLISASGQLIAKTAEQAAKAVEWILFPANSDS